jgi:GT2 family glycosyltransferase
MESQDLLPDLTLRRPRDLNPVHVITRNFSVRADAFRDAGGFDETFTGYGWEDIELALRLRARGTRFLWEPRARTWHHHVESLASARRKQRESGRGAVYFWRKHGSATWLGMFLEIHPALLPLKRLVFRSGVFTPPAWWLLRRVEPKLDTASGRTARGWTRLASRAICSACYVHLMWDAYYEGVFEALRAPAPGRAAP